MLMATSDIVREVDRALWLIGGVSVVMLGGITLAMVMFAVKYRRGKIRTTSQIEGHMWLEVTWVVIPTIIVTWMFFVGYRGFALMRSVPPDAMVVEVTGRQWMWSFHYPEEKLDTAEMVVPVGKPVKVELTSPPDDVIHSFFIPDFRVKEDAVPGRHSYLWFEADREGDYNIFCAEFCGKDHSKMLSVLRVVSPRGYDEWVTAERMKRYEPLVFEAVVDPHYEKFGKDGLNIDSEALFKTYCQSCHGAAGDGSGLPGVARNFTSDQEKWKRGRKVTDIYRTLSEGIENTQMRAFPNLVPWERVALAHRVRSFFTSPAPEDTAEDYAALVKEYGLDQVQTPKPTIPIERAMEIVSEQAGNTGAPSGQTTSAPASDREGS
jgi:cytochrome c oxidase subunit II